MEMVKFIVFLFIMVQTAHATEQHKGIVTVLEAPIFAIPDEDSKVVQYVRKGEEIYIHPAEFFRDRYEGIIFMDENKVQNYEATYAKEFRDPLFPEGATYYPEPGSRFYKTLSASGKEAYILKDHVYLLYQDARELSQKVIEEDPTDYRIEEPLPEGYPLVQDTGYRGYLSFGMGVPTQASYPYTERINDIGYDFLKEVQVVWGKHISFDFSRRMFFGGMITVGSSKVDYLLQNLKATERETRFSVGPWISYDYWRSEDYALNISGSIQFAFLNLLDIEIKEKTGDFKETRSFRSTYFAPSIGISFQKKNIFSSLELIAGINSSMNLPHSYETADTTEDESKWKGNQFDRPFSAQVTYFLGLQSNY